MHVGDGTDVLYLSHQDDNLRKQLEGLILDDIAPSFPIADEALGSKPDAVNCARPPPDAWNGVDKAATYVLSLCIPHITYDDG